MNIKYKSIIRVGTFLCILAYSMSSCIEEYNAALPTSESNLLVVEGTILSDTTSTFYMSLSMPVNSGNTAAFINNATIQLIGTDGISVDGTNVGNGEYAIVTPKLNANAKYSVVINYDGDTYESDAQIPFPSIGVKNVEINQPSDTSSVNVLITTDVPDNTSEIQYFKWVYNETWEVHPDVETEYYWDPDSQVIRIDPYHFARRGWKYDTSDEIMASSSAYYSNNQIVKYKLYGIPRSDRRLKVLYCTEVSQRSITKAEYEYETERQKISTDMGGLFTPQPSALPTNIRCTSGSKRVLGYVGCSLNTTHFRMFAVPDSLNLDYVMPQMNIKTNSDEDYPGEVAMYNNGWLVSYYFDHPSMPLTIKWVEAKYIDLTKNGCSLEKPSYWPY